MLDKLVCNVCRQLITPEDVFLCPCQLVCSVCAPFNEQTLSECGNCSSPFSNSLEISNWYQRMLSVINHLCINQVFGCVYLVKPGDPHEDFCTFKPVECIICKQKITKILLHSHFELDHPGKYLKCRNSNVLIDSFWEDPVTGNHQIYCFPNVGGPILITLKEESDSDPDSAQFTLEGDRNEIDLRTSIKFNFNVMRMYRCQSSVKLLNNQKGVVLVKKECVKHWTENVSDLDINISRKQANKKSVKKTGDTKSIKKRTPKTNLD